MTFEIKLHFRSDRSNLVKCALNGEILKFKLKAKISKTMELAENSVLLEDSFPLFLVKLAIYSKNLNNHGFNDHTTSHLAKDSGLADAIVTNLNALDNLYSNVCYFVLNGHQKTEKHGELVIHKDFWVKCFTNQQKLGTLREISATAVKISPEECSQCRLDTFENIYSGKMSAFTKILCLKFVPNPFDLNFSDVNRSIYHLRNTSGMDLVIKTAENDEQQWLNDSVYTLRLQDLNTGYILWKRVHSKSPFTKTSLCDFESRPNYEFSSPFNESIDIKAYIPPHAQALKAFSIKYVLSNRSSDKVEQLQMNCHTSDSFLYSGPKTSKFNLLPNSTIEFFFNFLPLEEGMVFLPTVHFIFERPDVSLTKNNVYRVFVFPYE